MRKLYKKIAVAMLAFALTISGLYLVMQTGITAKAEGIDEGVFSIKLQKKENGDGSVDLRVVSSVDSLDYASVGFEVYYDGATTPIDFETTTVLERISATSNVAYNFSPKVIDVKSEYFVTGTIKNIASTNLEKTFYIRPFATQLNSTVREYGIGRYFTVSDAEADGIINIPVAMDEAPATSELAVTLAGQSTTAEVLYYDGEYAHLNVTVPAEATLAPEGTDKTAEKANLPSATLVKLESGETAIYRNLDSSYANNGADSTWQSVYAAIGEEQFVVATDADLYGLAALANAGSTLSDTTVYAVADIDASATAWTSIGTETNQFAGTFNGQGHTISGVNQTTAEADALGFFQYITTNAVVEDMKLADSTFTYTGEAAEGGLMGSVVAVANGGTIQEVYSSATMSSAGSVAGGIVGKVAGNTTISNSWFAGSINMTATDMSVKAAGIVGAIDNTSATVEHCLNSGSVTSATPTDLIARIGGLVGSVEELEGETEIAIGVHDSLNTGVITAGAATAGVATLIGYDASNGVTLKNCYATAESCGVDSLKGTDNGLYQVDTDVDITTANLAMITDIKGSEAFANTTLQFAEYWSAVTDGTPMLTSFVTDEDIVTGEIHVSVGSTDTYDADGLAVTFEGANEGIVGMVDAGNYITMIAEPGEYAVSTKIFGLEQSLGTIMVEEEKEIYEPDTALLSQVPLTESTANGASFHFDYATSSTYFEASQTATKLKGNTLTLGLTQDIKAPFSITAKFKVSETDVIDEKKISEHLKFGVFARENDDTSTTRGLIFYSHATNTKIFLQDGQSHTINVDNPLGYVNRTTWKWSHNDYSQALIDDGLWFKWELTKDQALNVYCGLTNDSLEYLGTFEDITYTNSINKVYCQFNQENGSDGYRANIENINVQVAQDITVDLTGDNLTATGAEFTFTPEAGTAITATADTNNQVSLKAEAGTYEVTTEVFGVTASLGTIEVVEDVTEYTVKLEKAFVSSTQLDNGNISYDFATGVATWNNKKGVTKTTAQTLMTPLTITGQYSITSKLYIPASEILNDLNGGTTATVFGYHGQTTHTKYTGDVMVAIFQNGVAGLRNWYLAQHRNKTILGSVSASDGVYTITGDATGYYDALTTEGQGLYIRYTKLSTGYMQTELSVDGETYATVTVGSEYEGADSITAIGVTFTQEVNSTYSGATVQIVDVTIGE